MKFENFRRFVSAHSIADGTYRGLYQMPLLLAATLHAKQFELGYLVLFCLFSVPLMPTFLFELITGYFIYRKSQGAFYYIIHSMILQAFALLLFALCFFTKGYTFLLLMTFAALVGQLGRCFSSGSIQECFRVAVRNLCSKEEEKSKLNNLYVLQGKTMFYTKPIATFSGITVLLLPFVDKSSWGNSIILVPFFISALVHLYLSVIAYRWYKWAKSEAEGQNSEYTSFSEELRAFYLPQIKIFLRQKGFIFSFTAGVVAFLILSMSYAGPTEKDKFFQSILFHKVIIIAVVATSFSFINKIGHSILFEKIVIPKFPFFRSLNSEETYSRIQTLSDLHIQRKKTNFKYFLCNGYFLLIYLSLVVLILSISKKWGFFGDNLYFEWTVSAFTLMLFGTPLLNTWAYGSMRQNLLQEVPEVEEDVRGAAFYFSLYSSMFELGLGLSTSFYTIFKLTDKRILFYLSACILVCFNMLYWFYKTRLPYSIPSRVFREQSTA